MKYSILADVYERLEKEPSKLKKTEILSELLSQTPTELLPKVVLLASGHIFPSYSELKTGIASKMMIKAIAKATGLHKKEIVQKFKELGDLGLVAEECIKEKKQVALFKKQLTVELVFEDLQKLATLTGAESQQRKLDLIAELLVSANPKEARYIVRTVLETLRIGVAEGIVRDAIAKAFFADIVWEKKRVKRILEKAKNKIIVVEKGLLKKFGIEKTENKISEKSLSQIEKMELWKPKSNVDYVLLMDNKVGSELKNNIISTIENAWFRHPDYGEIARIAKEKGEKALKKVKIQLGKPIMVMLGEKAPSLEDALKKFDRCILEYKYDGARTNIHKDGEKIWLYTRRLENVTNQFPDLVKLAKNGIKVDQCIIEGETIGMDPKTGEPIPFQKLSKRIQRKYDVAKMVKKIPIRIYLFDILYLNGKSLTDKPLKERRRLLEKSIKEIPGKFELTKSLITKDLEEAQKFYKEALKAKQEGLMIKNLDAPYQSGRRVGYMLKVKPTMESLDLAIIGAEWGTGKRAKWLGSYVLACRDPDTGKYLSCGMMGTGLTDEQFQQMTDRLKPLIIREKGRSVEVKPEIIVEVEYEEIQKSPHYDSGYALRFPRMKTIREEKPEPDDINRLKRLFESQFKKMNV